MTQFRCVARQTASLRFCLIALALLASRAFGQQAQPGSVEKLPQDALDGPPLVTAKAWVIGDGRTGQRLWGHEDQMPRAIASTTKIMTAWLVVQLIEKDASLAENQIKFSERADKTSGTSAGLKAGEAIAARDLLFGLLLPSGNDAAVALAEHFGCHFAAGGDEKTASAESNYTAFLEQMNLAARQLELAETHYLDPHGLGANRSSARDLLRLAHAAMQSAMFRRYVQTTRHACHVLGEDNAEREVVWNNTNQLLRIEGFDGVKTGTTTPAGACLVGSCHRGSDYLLTVVLGATSSDARYIDTRNLLRWAWQQRKP